VNLDLLRSLAVLVVVVHHIFKLTGYENLTDSIGRAGVCMFFVHTSLVLMWSIERDPQVARFYIRRIFRIYPLWIAVLLFVIVFKLPQTAHDVFPHFGHGELIANLLLIFNLKFGANLVGASWTLPIEVQMYLFLPFLFFFVRGTRLLWPLLLCDLFLMAYARELLPADDATLAMCVPYFLPGVMAYVLTKRTTLRRLPGWFFPVFLSVLLLIQYRFGSLRQSWFFCLALGLGIPLFRDIAAAPIRVAAHQIAKYSYGIYLTHTTLIVFAVRTLHTQPMPLRIGLFVVTLCLVPMIFYHVIEAPMIRFGARLARRVDKGPGPQIDRRLMDLEPAP
jgi:peptidoglycan/LPS O-acetylase OafA/YrhL